MKKQCDVLTIGLVGCIMMVGSSEVCGAEGRYFDFEAHVQWHHTIDTAPKNVLKVPTPSSILAVPQELEVVDVLDEQEVVLEAPITPSQQLALGLNRFMILNKEAPQDVSGKVSLAKRSRLDDALEEVKDLLGSSPEAFDRFKALLAASEQSSAIASPEMRTRRSHSPKKRRSIRAEQSDDEFLSASEDDALVTDHSELNQQQIAAV